MISCEEYYKIVKNSIKKQLKGIENVPKFRIYQVGDNQASNLYVRNKIKDCNDVGIQVELCKYPDTIYQQELKDNVFFNNLYEDTHMDAQMIQFPLPSHINKEDVLMEIDPSTDVDGLTHASLFDPCTPLGIINWLDYNGFQYEGVNAVVLGRSDLVGKPLTRMLIDKGCTVTCCNSHSDVGIYLKKATLVISAIGRPKFWKWRDFALNYDNSKRIIIDVGINHDENGKLCGDVDPANFDIFLPNYYLTPVPKGVGLLTRSALLQNIMKASYLNKK